MDATPPPPNVTNPILSGGEAWKDGLASRDYLNNTDWLVDGWITAEDIAPG